MYHYNTQDILKDQWSPALTIKTALLSLQALMCSPEPDDPQDAEVANMYKTNYQTFAQTAKFWTEMYAAVREGGGDQENAVSACLLTYLTVYAYVQASFCCCRHAAVRNLICTVALSMSSCVVWASVCWHHWRFNVV
jgi:Ubiquitin-conjugating enzyme